MVLTSRRSPCVLHALRLALAGLVAFTTLAATAQPIVLKVHHFWPANAMAPTRILQPWCDRIAAESAGRMKCELFPAMQLGGTPAQLLDQARDGVADIVLTLPGYAAGRYPVMEVFELPFMINSAEQGSRAAWDFYQKYGQAEFASRGVKPLLFATHDRGYLHTREKQIRTMADFKGLRLRAPTRQTNKLLAALGATPVAMPLPAVGDAVRRGLVDGYVLPWEVIPATRLHELVKYDTETDPARPALYTALFVMAMNQARFDGLPADLKAIIDRNSGAGLSRQAGRAWDESTAGARQSAVERGNVFFTVPATELDRWIQVSQPLYSEWVADIDHRGMPGRQMLDEVRALLVKYRK